MKNDCLISLKFSKKEGCFQKNLGSEVSNIFFKNADEQTEEANRGKKDATQHKFE